MVGVADEGARGLVLVAFAICDELFVEGRHHEEEDANVDDVGGGG